MVVVVMSGVMRTSDDANRVPVSTYIHMWTGVAFHSVPYLRYTIKTQSSQTYSRWVRYEDTSSVSIVHVPMPLLRKPSALRSIIVELV